MNYFRHVVARDDNRPRLVYLVAVKIEPCVGFVKAFRRLRVLFVVIRFVVDPFAALDRTFDFVRVAVELVRDARSTFDRTNIAVYDDGVGADGRQKIRMKYLIVVIKIALAPCLAGDRHMYDKRIGIQGPVRIAGAELA